MTKTMTAAMLKADKFRDQLNDGREKVLAEDNSCVVYLFDLKGKPCARGYKGRALKASLYYSYATVEAREKSVKGWMDSISGRASSRKQAEERVLKVGDILKSSWGYEQTNIDFYKVLRLVGKSSVEIVRIGAIGEATSDMTRRLIPDASVVIGEPMRKLVSGNRIKITSFSSACLMVPTMVMGVPVYKPSFSSSYA